MKKSILLLILSLSFSLTACGQAPSAGLKNDVEAKDEINTTKIDSLQLRKDIGEILMVGFRGTQITAASHIVRDIKEYNVGGVILFEYDAPSGKRHRNVESPAQLKRLCSDLQSLTSDMLLIGIDQEGGSVCRMRAKDGFPYTMSAEKSAQYGDDSVTFYAMRTADMLRQAGVNVNFAPCVDLNINPSCPVIGKMGRSFSDNPERVSQCAAIWIKNQREAGVASCLKHFPGHGSASGDTHKGLVDVSSTWKNSELEPYKTLFVNPGVEMVMVAHVVNNALSDGLPASLSKHVIQDILRKELGFRGVVVTDDLAMGAITKMYGYEEAIRMAIVAGNDMLCISNNGGGVYDPNIVPKTVAMILSMIGEGKVSAEDIHESAERIRALKRQLSRGNDK